jgi:ribose transport system ATP-binding protein
MIIGRRLQALSLENTQPDAGKAISITGLTGRYARDVSLTVHEGEVVGLTGLPGSGFEEIPYYVFGARPAAAGRLELDGKTHDLRGMSPSRALEAGVALVPADRQRDGCVGSLSLDDNVTVRTLHEFRSRVGLSRSRMRSAARKLLEQFDVRPSDPRLTYQSLSGGNQQKAMLAKWLQTKPSLLLAPRTDAGRRRRGPPADLPADEEGRSRRHSRGLREHRLRPARSDLRPGRRLRSRTRRA